MSSKHDNRILVVKIMHIIGIVRVVHFCMVGSVPSNIFWEMVQISIDCGGFPPTSLKHVLSNFAYGTVR